MHASQDVRDAMIRFCEAFTSNDVGVFEGTITAEPDAGVIGTGPAERYEGRTNWIDAYAQQIAAIPGIALTAGDPSGFEEGGIGWAADQPTFVLPDGTPVPVRLTAVLRRESDEWKMVHAHFSMGVPDDLLEAVLTA